MRELVKRAPGILCTMPGKGPFEQTEMDVPDFAVLHGEFISPSARHISEGRLVLAFVCNTVWEATHTNLVGLSSIETNIKNVVDIQRTMWMAHSTEPKTSPSSIESTSTTAWSSMLLRPPFRSRDMSCTHIIRFNNGWAWLGKLLADSPVTVKSIQVRCKPQGTWKSAIRRTN